MGLDIRTPIGMMFSILGALLVLYGLLTANDTAIYARSLGTNLNLWWGVCLLVFGAGMFIFGRRGTSKNKPDGMRPTADSVEGEMTEEIEHEEGLEKS